MSIYVQKNSFIRRKTPQAQQTKAPQTQMKDRRLVQRTMTPLAQMKTILAMGATEEQTTKINDIVSKEKAIHFYV